MGHPIYKRNSHILFPLNIIIHDKPAAHCSLLRSLLKVSQGHRDIRKQSPKLKNPLVQKNMFPISYGYKWGFIIRYIPFSDTFFRSAVEIKICIGFTLPLLDPLDHHDRPLK